MDEAVNCALYDQNLRKRFNLRSGRDYKGIDSNEEPMDVGHVRPRMLCQRCNRTNHNTKDCRANIRPHLGMNVYKALKVKPKITNHFVNLQSVNGESLEVKGRVNLNFEMNGTKLNHDFYLVKNRNRNLIIGHDFLTKNGVRLYFDLACLRVNNTFVRLIKIFI